MKPQTRVIKLTAWLLMLTMLVSFMPAFIYDVSASDGLGINIYEKMLEYIKPENKYGLGDIPESRILHAWGWSYKNIKTRLEVIAEQGFSTILVSPPNEIKMPTNGVKFHEPETYGISPNGWWMLYQPAGFQLNESDDNAFGTKDDFVALCDAAHRLGLKIMVEAVVGYAGTDDDYVGEYDNVSANPIDHVNSRMTEFEPELLYESAFRNPWVNCTYKERYWDGYSDYDIEEDLTQHAVDGKPDLATETQLVQDTIYDYFVELVEAGADGFYFNDAKHIETASDTYFPSDFWEDTLGKIRENYPDKNLQAVAELIGGSGDGRSAEEYLQYGMNLTHTAMSDTIRDSVVKGIDITDAFDDAFPQENSVLWGESYKSYANGETSALTSEQRAKMWALTASRKGVQGIYLARPSDELAEGKSEINNILSAVTLGEGNVTDWSTDVVKRINHFAGFFADADENVYYDNGFAVIERDEAGAVLVNMKGKDAEVSISEKTLIDGNYTDAITGNEFTVENGKITGEIGESGIAVLYLSDDVLIYNLWLGGERLVSNNSGIYVTDDNGDITGSATYDFSTNTLLLDDFIYSSDGDINAVIRYTGSDDLKLVLSGTSNITCTNGSGFGVYSKGNIEISGSGSLSVKGGSYGVDTPGSITVSGGEIIAQGATKAFSKAPTIADTFENAVCWYGENADEANNAGAKPIADLEDNYYQKYVKVAENATAASHSITVTAFEHGTVTADKATAAAGETVMLTITPDSGYALQSVTINGTSDETVIGKTEVSFTMPDEDAVIFVTFKEGIPVCFDNSESQWTYVFFRYDNGYDEGIHVGSDIYAFIISENAVGQFTNYMPGMSQEMFPEGIFRTEDITPVAGQTYHYVGYDIIVDDNISGGTIIPKVTKASYGQTVTLTVTPDSGMTVKQVIVKAGNRDEIEVTESINHTYSFTMPKESVTVTAVFEEVTSDVIVYNLRVGGELFTSEKLTVTDENGGTVTYDPDTNTLTLNNYTYTGANAIFYYGEEGETLYLNIIGDNNLSAMPADNAAYSTAVACLYANLQIFGSGSLTANVISQNTDTADAIYADGDILIQSGTIKATGGNAQLQASGIVSAEGDITINGGNVTAIGGEAISSIGLYSDKNISITGGVVIAEGELLAIGAIGTISIGTDLMVYDKDDAVIQNPDYYSLVYAKIVGKHKLIWSKGDSESYEQDIAYGAAITVPDNELFNDTMRKSGYNLVGWTNEDGYKVGDPMPAKDITFTAQYRKISSGGGGSSSISTTITKNEDGSTTKITTNKATGTITETTTYSDGSTIKVESKKDGTVTTTERDKDGNTTTTVLKPDGTSITTEKNKDGSEKVTEEKADGTTITFEDVHNVGHWAAADIDYVYIKGLMMGTSETHFSPDVPLTRAMLVTVLYRLEGEPATNRSIPFADVDMGAYYASAVSWAKQNGIVKGISETEFAPNDNITREQIAAIMHRYAQYKGYDVSVGENTNILSYDDFDSISEYAIAAMQYACGSGLMKGKTISTLNPLDSATRSEIAAVLHRFIESDN